jgi:GntR family transcriptional regulator, arabinose operon transcriptional repressor
MLSMTNHLYERIVASVMSDLKSGRLRPGDRVPSEHALAEQFEVSRITSRKALEVLAQANVVERSQGRGTFIVQDLPNLEALGGLVSPKVHQTQTNLLGLILPDFSDTYGLQMVYAIEESCAANGLYLLLKRTNGIQANEEAAIGSLLALGVDGLIVFPVHGEHYNPVLLRLVLERKPLVLVDRFLKGIPAHAVATDNNRAAFALTEHLIALGHQDIAFVSPPVANTSALEERLAGFDAALTKHHLPRRTENRLENLLSTLPRRFQAENIAADQAVLTEFVQRSSATAFVCTEYNLALTLCNVLQHLGKAVPADVSLVCFDSPLDPIKTPRFTHIRQDEAGIGVLAVQQILAQLRGEHAPARHHVPFLLLEGRSTAFRLEVPTDSRLEVPTDSRLEVHTDSRLEGPSTSRKKP